jgi:pantoate--beta-alanine ligase
MPRLFVKDVSRRRNTSTDMRQAQTREQLWAVVRNWRRVGQKIALVPTMGNLHDGHLALVASARGHADRVITSIFVNPTQFGEGEDFELYPRTLEQDQRLLEAAHCDLVFTPNQQTVYPGGLEDTTRILAAPSLANQLEGAARPGHFDGVVTVVARLFNLVGPDLAVFGEKDYQQLLVIRRMVEDLGYPVQIASVPTVRSPRGLALSSRNRYLDDVQRTAAEQLNKVLDAAVDRMLAAPEDRLALEQEAREHLEREGLRVDYLTVRRAQDLAEPGEDDRDLRIMAAVWCGRARLIDNLPCTLS